MKEIDSSITQYNNSILRKGLSAYKGVICIVLGAPFNVAYNMSSLGDEVTFVGQVGDDYFGNFILDKLREKDNLTLSIEKLKNKNTTIALNVIDGKNRKYSFIRKNTADYAYNSDF